MSAKKRYVSSLSEPEAGLVHIVHDPQCAACRQSRQIQEKAQDYSGFGLKSQTATPKSAQLASRAPAGAELKSGSTLRSVGDRLLNVACAMLRNGTQFNPSLESQKCLLNGRKSPRSPGRQS